MIIDGHAHASGEFWTAAGILGVLDALGVAAVVLSPGPVNAPKKYPVPNLGWLLRNSGLNEAGQRLLRFLGPRVLKRHPLSAGNAGVARLAAEAPGRVLQSFWVDPNDRAMVDGLDSLHRQWGFRVLKVHQCMTGFESGSPVLHELARFAGGRGLPFFIHSYLRRDAAGLLPLIAAHPRTTFVLAHLLNLGVFEKAGRDALPNVHFDISPPNLVPESQVMRAIRAFGADRVLLGSDTPFGRQNLKKSLDRVRGLGISEGDKRLILGENMRRLLGL